MTLRVRRAGWSGVNRLTRPRRYRPSSAARPPKKHARACLSQAPTKRGVCTSVPAAALLPVDATHVAAVPSTPAAISAKPPAVASRQTHWRVTSNWPPSPCPLHGATRPLPTPAGAVAAKILQVVGWLC
jgi:hypothetical protein